MSKSPRITTASAPLQSTLPTTVQPAVPVDAQQAVEKSGFAWGWEAVAALAGVASAAFAGFALGRGAQSSSR